MIFRLKKARRGLHGWSSGKYSRSPIYLLCRHHFAQPRIQSTISDPKTIRISGFLSVIQYSSISRSPTKKKSSSINYMINSCKAQLLTNRPANQIASQKTTCLMPSFVRDYPKPTAHSKFPNVNTYSRNQPQLNNNKENHSVDS